MSTFMQSRKEDTGFQLPLLPFPQPPKWVGYANQVVFIPPKLEVQDSSLVKEQPG